MNSFVWLYNLLAPVKISSPYLDLILPVGISLYFPDAVVCHRCLLG